MCKKYFKSLVSIATIVCILSAFLSGETLDPNVSLERSLSTIAAKDKGEGTDVRNLENACLNLLEKHNSPQDKGIIYAKIAFVYSGKGYSSPNDMRIAKTKEYCKKALTQPLEPITSAEIYSCLAGAQTAYKWNRPNQEFTKARKESIENYLTALKVVLDNNAPAEKTEPPGVGKYDINPANPDYDKVVQKHQQELTVRQKWNSDQKLYILRRGLIGQCVDLYSHRPYDTEELETYAREMLKGHDDVIDELIAKVNERIQRQGNTRE